MTKAPAQKSIDVPFYCGDCLAIKPMALSAASFAYVEIGLTPKGLQVWCLRHGSNVIHMDFEGVQHPINVEARS